MRIILLACIFTVMAAVSFCLPDRANAQASDAVRQACTPDAMRLCSDVIPDVPKVTACMKAKSRQLSQACGVARAPITITGITGSITSLPEFTRPRCLRRGVATKPGRLSGCIGKCHCAGEVEAANAWGEGDASGQPVPQPKSCAITRLDRGGGEPQRRASG